MTTSIPDFFTTKSTLKTPAPKMLHELFARAGITVNGDQPWDIQLLDKRAFSAILTTGSLGLGESYCAGYWECSDLASFFTRLLTVRLDRNLNFTAKTVWFLQHLKYRLSNMQIPSRTFMVGQKHYDIGNNLYQAMLDENLCYSCGFWQRATNLDQAQEHKLDLICRKLRLEPGMRVLDVGCGFGSLAKYMAENYKVEVTGITVSQKQARLAQYRCEGLPVCIELMDYRLVNEKYDRIVSVGMFEHVGHKNYSTYFDTLKHCLDSQGYFLLHTIGTSKNDLGIDPWIEKYIFPNGELPSLPRLVDALQPRFIVEDLHNFGPDYDKTLMSWWHNFYLAWPELSSHYDQHFLRMWRYYLMCSAGFFRSRRGQLWQWVLSSEQNHNVYRSLR